MYHVFVRPNDNLIMTAKYGQNNVPYYVIAQTAPEVLDVNLGACLSVLCVAEEYRVLIRHVIKKFIECGEVDLAMSLIAWIECKAEIAHDFVKSNGNIPNLHSILRAQHERVITKHLSGLMTLHPKYDAMITGALYEIKPKFNAIKRKRRLKYTPKRYRK